MAGTGWSNRCKRIHILVLFISMLPVLAQASPVAPSDETFNRHDRTFESKRLRDELFPQPPELAPNVNFWLDIYTKYKSNEAVIHDSENLKIVYEVLDLDGKVGAKRSMRAKNRYMEKRKRHYAKILRQLARHKGKCRTQEECRVAGLFNNEKKRSVYKKAARNVRGQYGLADRFLEGLETSGLYIEEMASIFASHGLPAELLALPHVESSFNVYAYSKYGAAGIWQFTRSTGRLFLKINYTVDDRLDPIRATAAAAKLLKKNYRDLKSWPLAITAYNHGRRGMMRAKKKHGPDIVKIINEYRGRTFGFASRNFYAEFLAALKIMDNPERYFGPVNFKMPLKYDTVTLNDYVPIKVITKHLNYDKNEIAFLNPSLRPTVWNGTRRIPKGFEFRLPHGEAERFKQIYRKIPDDRKFSAQIRQRWYSVRYGDSLSTIARKFRTTVASLQEINGLDNRHRIFAGQKLEIPSRNYRPKVIMAKLNTNRPLRKAVKANLKLEPPAKEIEPVEVVKRFIALDEGMKRTTKKPAGGLHRPPVKAPDFSKFRFEALNENYGVIRVKAEETIGHFSHWAGVSVRKILKLNGKRSRRIHLGQTVKIPLDRVTAEQFESNRYEYHLGLFEDFFSAYYIDKVERFKVRKGQSLWTICNGEQGVPMWLVQLYNQDGSLEELHPGQVLRMPVIGRRDS